MIFVWVCDGLIGEVAEGTELKLRLVRIRSQVVCDSFSHEDYPVFVEKGQSVNKMRDEFNGKSTQRVMKVYDLRKSRRTA